MIKILDRVIVYSIIIIGIIFLCTSFSASRSQEAQAERLRDNLLWQTEQAVKRLDIKDKELKELAGRTPTTIIETIIKHTEEVSTPVSVPHSVSFEGEDAILKWKVKEAIFSYQLKPISITVIESPKGWLFKASEGFYIEGQVQTLPKKDNALWGVLGTRPSFGLCYQRKNLSLAGNYAPNQKYFEILLGVRFYTF